MDETPKVDWTGVAPSEDKLEPLTPETFVRRLNSLTEALAQLKRLRRALVEQTTD